jgi:hypothetical protein
MTTGVFGLEQENASPDLACAYLMGLRRKKSALDMLIAAGNFKEHDIGRIHTIPGHTSSRRARISIYRISKQNGNSANMLSWKHGLQSQESMWS